MNVQVDKLELVQLLIQTNKESVLKKIESILLGDKSDWWDEIGEDEKAEIQLGIEQADKGEFGSFEELKKQPKRWL